MSKRRLLSTNRVVFALMLLAMFVLTSSGTGSPQPPGRAPVLTAPSFSAPSTAATPAPAPPRARAVKPATPAASSPVTLSPTTNAVTSGSAPVEKAAGVEVEPALTAEIQEKGVAGYLVYFRDRPNLDAAEKMDWIARGRFVAQQLQATAENSQKAVRAYLDGKGVTYKAFWIDNVILVESSNLTIFNELQNFPEIGVMRSRRTEKLIEPVSKDPLVQNQPMSIEPNISHVQAPDVWALGYTGTGSVVSSVDTGVRYSHQALVGKYRGNLGGGTFNHNYNWWDPYGNHPANPADDNGHGSHTMGTMVGDDGGSNQIGMAPGAKWIACRGCNTSSCTDAALLECAQFIATPWDLTEANPNPDMRPNSVNNSWGDCLQSYDSWYQGVVDNWRAFGIYPVFSNGNASNCGYSSPPACGTVGNPARYGNVTGVGATGQQNGAYATFSNRGPTDRPDTENGGSFPTIKPQVAAPGSNIRSSVNTSDTAYEGGWSGTSMSAPHVTGLTALIYQAAPCLKGNFVAVENILQQSAAIASGVPGTCAGEDADGVPNQSTGWGEIRALAAVQLALTSCGPMGTLDGTVTSGGNPIAGATVQAVGTENTFQAITDAAGHFAMTLPVGTYDVNVSAYGYMPANIPGVIIQENATTTLPVVLDPAPSFVVSGQVLDQAIGWGLYATITIDGYPGLPITTDPATGNYSITLVAGQNYTFNAAAFAAGYLPLSVDTGVLTGDLTLNLPLVADANNCVAPGYVLDVTGVYETFEGAFPPAGWTVTKTADSECQWVGNDPGGRGNLTGGSGGFAIADSDDCGSGTTMNTDMISPIMDVSTLLNVNLSYNYDYNNLSSSELADIDVSADGGATWTNVQHWNTDHRGPGTFMQDLTPLLGGSTQAQIRFRYVAPGWDWWWEVDNVFVGEKNCHPIGGGGLVLGRVADANDDHALIGATVSSDTGASATAVAAPDPAMGNIYMLFQPAGDHALTATMAGYSPSTATVTVPNGAALRHDFALQTGHLTYTPANIDETIPAGGTTVVPVTVQNIGGGSATFSLSEISKGAVPFTTPPVNSEPRTGLAASTAPSPVQITGGPWQPTGDISLVLDDGTMEDSVGVNSSSAAFQFIWLNRFTPDPGNFPFNLEEVTVMWPTGQVAVGNAMQIVVYADTDGDGNPADATLLYSENVTVQTVGAWNTYTLATPVQLDGPGDVLIGFIDRFVNSGVTPPNYPAALDETASAGRSWVGWWNADPPASPALPPDNTFATIDSLGLPGNWMIRASGSSGIGDVPWLSENPTQVTLGAGESVVVNVTLDGSAVVPGVYTAELKFVHDTPYPVPNMPVKMTASIPPTMGKLAGTVSSNGECDNEPEPLAGATVTVNSASFAQPITLTTDDNGYYYIWLDQSASPLTVSVNAGPDYATGSASNVMLYGQQTTVQDFSLRYLGPCLTASPRSILVNLPLGTSTTAPLTLRNLGGATATFEFENVATGYTPPAAAPLAKRTTTVTIGDLGTASKSNPQASSTLRNAAGNVLARNATSIGGATFESAAAGSATKIDTFAAKTFSRNPNPPTNSTDPNFDNAPKIPNGSMTITQSNSQTITAGNSVSCNNGFGHTANHYLRVFDLPTFGITSDFAITNVSFGIESSAPAGATQPVEVRLFTLNGAFQFANLTPIGNATAAVGAQTLTILNVPVTGTAPAGAKLVVDIFTPDGQSAGNLFFVGSNGLGETGPSYLAAADCSVPEPVTTASLGFPEMMIVMNVTGEVGGGLSGPAWWLSENPATGTVAADGLQPVVVTFDAGLVNEPGTYKASALVHVAEDPDDVIDVETTMVVTAPANWGILQGTISSLGHCDTTTAPLEGATVVATGSNGLTRTATTGADGSYSFWLPDYGSPYTLEATEPNHLIATATGIAVVGLGTTTQDLSLRWLRPCVAESPAAITATVEWQQSATIPMTLTNSGAAATPFAISEMPGQFIPMGVNANQFLIYGSGSPANAMKLALDNLGFTYDAVTTLPADLTPYMAVLYNGAPSAAHQTALIGYLNSGGRLLIADNDWGYANRITVTPLYGTYFQATYVADAGSDGPIQGVDIEAGTNTDISSDPYPDSFTFGPDATGIFANTAPRTNWAGMKISRLAYKGVYLAWDYHYAGGSAVGDPIETEILGKILPWLTASDVDWLSEAPDSGTLAANGGSQNVNVTVNSAAASVLQPGTYTAQLKIDTQDPENASIYVPVSMTVNPAPTYGKIWGTVRGLGACDLNPAPIQNATVLIQYGTNSATVKTDANGYYQLWFTAANPTIGLTVTADGHMTESRASFFWAGDDPRNQQDFDLHWLQPCGSMTPDSLSATVTMGESAELPATIFNTGWAPMNFSFRASSSGYVPMGGTTAGEDVLLISGTTAAGDAVAASLTRLGYSYYSVTPSGAPPVAAWTSYAAVIWAGSASSDANATAMQNYLDLGGNLLITYYDLGYYHYDQPLYTSYLEATYLLDAGSDGTITGADIMAGLNINISADPYPDSFSINGPNAVPIFSNDAPKTDLSGLRIAKNGYKAVYLAWNFNFTGTTDGEKDAVLGRAMNWLAPSATWIQPAPTSGTVAEQSEQAVAVTLNSGVPEITQPGTYLGVLKMATNTPGAGAVAIPVTMVVNPQATWGKIEGTVQGLGYCDDDPAALADGSVVVAYGETTVDLKTDANGYYSYWLDSAVGPVTLTVNVADHEVGTATVDVSAGQTTTQDFSLRWLKACSSTAPTSYNVNVPLNGTLDQPLTLFNNGAAATDWELVAIQTAGAAKPITTTPVPGAPHNGATLMATKALGVPNTVKSTEFTPMGPVNLVVDDGTAENSIGVTDGVSSYQFIWLNRFTPAAADFPFELEQISILWPTGQVAAGNSVELVVYQDTDGDGDPTDAEVMGTFAVTVQNTDGTTWDNYTLPDPLMLGGPGDVLIGAINRWVTSQVTPAQWPANIDQTASQGRSWIGWWNTDPPSPPALPPDNTFGTIDSLGFAGNWLIRASGSTATGVLWLTTDPETGNIAADSEQPVTVHFDPAAAALAPGIYHATLRYNTADPVNPTVSLPVTMNHGVLPHFTIDAPASSMTGAAFSATVTARNNDGTVNTSYTGTVHFTSSDPTAVLPADYTFVAGDAGVHTFSVTLVESGVQSVTATDTADSTMTGQAMVEVMCQPLVANAANDGPLCEGSTLNLTVDLAGASYSWTGPNGFTSTVQNPSIEGVTVAASGQYDVTVTTENGCTYSDSTMVSIVPGPVATITAPTFVCPSSTGNVASIPAIAGATYAWAIAGGTITAGQGTNSITFTAGTGPTVELNATANNGVCTANGSASIPTTPSSVTITAPKSVIINSTGNVASVPAVAGVTYEWALTGGTITAGQGTNSIEFSAGSPGTTMTLSITETVSGGCVTAASTMKVQVDFLDVPAGHPLREFVNTLARNGVTGGCGGGNYCPGNSVTRAQMAVFLLVTKEGAGYAPPPATGTMFTDVPASSFAAAWIEELARRGITGGCGGGNYCPTAAVTRAQMAVFLLVTKEGTSYVPPDPIGVFGDVPVESGFAKWIEEIYNRGITGGCSVSPLLYCPANPVTRGQMAVFLTAMFNLQ